jgi:membrane-bound lysozyme inhibitor of c-type lysozyme MliC
MRPFGIAGLPLLLLAGCAAAHEDHGPAGVPYACEEGGEARVTYWAGGASTLSRARVQHGGQVYELTQVPAEYGLRYAGVAGASVVTWSVSGETAMLSTIASDAPPDAAPRETSCPRRRDGGGEAAPEEPAHH